MSYQSILTEIRQRFIDQVATPLSLDVEYENLPSGGTDNAIAPPREPETDTLFVRAYNRPGAAQQAEIGKVGTRSARWVGLLIVQVFVPSGLGTKPGYDIADKMLVEFGAKTVGSVTYGLITPTYAGPAGDRWQLNLSCPWTAEFMV